MESIHSYHAIKANREIECINIAALASRKEKVISRPVGDDEDDDLDPEIEFVLTNRRRKPVRVRCRWHRACSGSAVTD